MVEDNSGTQGDSKPNKTVSKKFGMDAYAHRDDHELIHPIQRGIVQDWDRMRDLLSHVFYTELQCDPKYATVLMTDSPMSRKEDKQHLA